MEMLTCYRKFLDNITAVDAFKSISNGEKVYSLVYSPDFCGFASPDSVSDIFEMRCFNESTELHWIGNNENGRAVIVSEKPEIGNGERFYKRSGHYLLWGTTTKQDGKTFMFDHRIGTMEIPLDVEPGKRVYLNFDEFFSPDEQHGNIFWRFERLKGFTVRG